MSRRKLLSTALFMAMAIVVGIVNTQSASACGGFFCQNSPIDQNAERIIFTQNGDGTTSAYIQIQYTGSAPDFSWILPLPGVISTEDIEVPEDAMAAFQELEVNTDPVFIRPELPECVFALQRRMNSSNVQPSAAFVEVFASGEVGPYGFDVIGSEDPDALMDWLRENDYRVTAEMEPLINVYTEEEFVFLAMRLLPDQGSQDVQPVKITYPAEQPMIPLRLTAVAANPNMAVMTWFYAEHQATPVNFARMEIANDELVFFAFGGSSNYRQLMMDKADEANGHAFLTEYAGPTSELNVRHPLLQELGNDFAYVTRLNTVISPEEMTVDPIFDYDSDLEDVSNIRDLSDMKGVYDCEEDDGGITSLPIISTLVSPFTGDSSDGPSGSRPQPGRVDTSSAPSNITPGIVTAEGDENGIGGLVILGAGILIGGLAVALVASLVYIRMTSTRSPKQ